jgi:hypothetical protein
MSSQQLQLPAPLGSCRFQCLAALLPQLRLQLARADILQAHHSSPQRIWPPSRRLLPSPPWICSELMVHATVDKPERGCAGRGAVDSGVGGGEGAGSGAVCRGSRFFPLPTHNANRLEHRGEHFRGGAAAFGSAPPNSHGAECC